MRTLKSIIAKNTKAIEKKSKQQYRKIVKKQVRGNYEIGFNCDGYDNRIVFKTMAEKIIDNYEQLEKDNFEIDLDYVKSLFIEWRKNQEIFKGEETLYTRSYYGIPRLLERFKNFKTVKDIFSDYECCLKYRNWFIDKYFTKPLIDGLEKENPLSTIGMITQEALRLLEKNVSFSGSTYRPGSNMIVGNSNALNIRKPVKYAREPNKKYTLKTVEVDVEYVNRKQPELDKIEELLFSLKLDKDIPTKKEVVKKKKKI